MKIRARELKAGMTLIHEGLEDEERRDKITSVSTGNGVVHYKSEEGSGSFYDEDSEIEVEA